jgi:hypothetical protein
LNIFNNLNAFNLNSPETPEHCGECNEGPTCGVDNHVGFPLVFEVAAAKDLYQCEENPSEKENKSVHKEERHGSFYGSALSSQLGNIGL